MDMITGVFKEKELLPILGSTDVNPFTGHTSGARLDFPGLGSIQVIGTSPGLMASFTYALGKSETNNSFKKGRVFGKELIELMAEYKSSLNILIVTDDEIDRNNSVSVLPATLDENGAIPSIRYAPTRNTRRKKRELVKIAADILLQAGARKVVHSDWPDGLMIHIMSTMRMGYVVDQNCESFQVSRLFIADNSVLSNGLGGQIQL
ncbi:GMC oxidoreductase [Halobacillus amylolyticus]|uniref:GMC oxidoreductase n=1 Tax=Halobacillus amylolyticus TaxID=2932259 RepID=UPI0029620EE8|nr:GMC oxidoreductase [Halobacillus amylolyticus]